MKTKFNIQFALAITLFCTIAFASCTYDDNYPQYRSYHHPSYLSPAYTAPRLSLPNVTLSATPNVTLVDTKGFELPKLPEPLDPKSLSVFSTLADFPSMAADPALLHMSAASSMGNDFMSTNVPADFNTLPGTTPAQTPSIPSMFYRPLAPSSLTAPSESLTNTADLITRQVRLLSDPLQEPFASPQGNLLSEPTQTPASTPQETPVDSEPEPAEEN